jgi:hypothetical protein
MHEIDLNADEEITLYSDEEQVTIDKVNHQFHQENKMKGEVREFTIFNDKQCKQTVRLKHGPEQDFRINLTCVDAKPRRDFVFSENWLMLGAIATVISLMLIYVVWFSSIKIDRGLGTVLVATSLSFSIICFLITMLKTRNRMQFLSKYARVPVLELIKNKPDSKSFTDFMKLLSQHIISAQHSAQLSTSERLKLELKELRRLKDDNVIPEPVYEQAKTCILRNKGFIANSA